MIQMYNLRNNMSVWKQASFNCVFFFFSWHLEARDPINIVLSHQISWFSYIKFKKFLEIYEAYSYLEYLIPEWKWFEHTIGSFKR